MHRNGLGKSHLDPDVEELRRLVVQHSDTSLRPLTNPARSCVLGLFDALLIDRHLAQGVLMLTSRDLSDCPSFCVPY